MKALRSGHLRGFERPLFDFLGTMVPVGEGLTLLHVIR
jgi:hypothetical protein